MVRAAPAPDALLPIVSVIKFYATRQSSSVTLSPRTRRPIQHWFEGRSERTEFLPGHVLTSLAQSSHWYP